MPTQYLVLTDVDAIQRYVFASIRMSTIVGGSEIVASFDYLLEEIAKKEFQANRAVLSGGNGLFVFSVANKADAFASRAATDFIEASVNGTLTASDVECFEDDSHYPAALRRALRSLETHKRRGCQSDEQLNLGLAWQCEYCGAEPAGLSEVSYADETRRLGKACLKRLDARDNARQCVASDFNELAGDDYLAVIVIDGDGLGQRLQDQLTPTEYENFSNKVKDCIERAMKCGKDKCLSAPLEILYRGGDDIVIACPSQWALPFAEAFSASLDAEDWRWAGGNDVADRRIGFSIGIAITHSGFPFRVAHRIANRLLRNAKQVAKEKVWTEGGIDFAIVTEAFADADVILEEREISVDNSRILLSGRPYRLKANESGSLSKLRIACSQLKDFARNRLYTLRNELTRSRLSGVVPADRITLGLIKDKIERLYAIWQERMDRVSTLKESWDAATENLPLGENIYPQGDLADALYLWEKCLVHQDPTHD